MALSMEYERKIEFFIRNIPKRIYRPIEKLEFEGFFTYERMSLDEAKKHKRSQLPKGLEWGEKWEYGWFFTSITIPEECIGKRVVFTAKQGESTVFVNGREVGAFDKEHTHITLTNCANGGEIFDIAMEVYAGHMGDDLYMEREKTTFVLPGERLCEFSDDVTQKTVSDGSFGIFNEEVFQLWMDIKTLYSLRGELNENSLRREMIDKSLSDMCNAVNIELPQEEFDISVQRGRTILKAALDCKNGSTAPMMYMIGHSHLDLEWLWTTNETRRKAARTLGNQLKIIEEYPEYKYIQSQPWILETVKNDYPQLYEKVKEAERNGNIIVEGGMWVESDVNIPSGESLIRQFVFGKKFIKDEYGKESEIFWLPDSFGMTAALPQIMKGCGIKYFMNAKIMWQYNGGDDVPYSNFMWQGIDDSEILTHLTQGYAEPTDPATVISKWNMNKEKADVPIGLVSYGHGDGGGGATRIHLEHLMREKDLEGMPRTKMASPNEFFSKLENECEINKKYVGELYYAAHRGTYTTQAKTKKNNRKSEFALREAEMWSALLGNQAKSKTDKLWKTVLFNQFHDIIPGTALNAVYEQTEKELTEVISSAEEITENALSCTIENKPEYISVFNSLSWDRTAYIELPHGYTSLEGCETQRINDSIIARVCVPSCGQLSYRLGIDDVENATKDDKLILENDLIKAEFNEDGELRQVYDKKTGTEFLTKPSNVFRIYNDMPLFFDAWDIDSFYEKEEIELSKEAEVYVEYKGSLESSIVIKKKINNSFLTQRVVLRKGSRRIDFETEIDWNETHKLLKVDFNTNIQTDELVSEIQFGNVKRPNHKTRHYDADRFEVCNHKWSALCESKRGAAILNDCKYGISADGSRMSLTLLRASVNPAPYTDKEIHKFTYSFMPFENMSYDGLTREGYELNCSIRLKCGYAEEKSLLSVSESNIIIDTVKYAEDNSGDIIIRLYECMNSYTQCALKCGFDIEEAYITNMLEENICSADVINNEVLLEFKAFEVKTLRIKI